MNEACSYETSHRPNSPLGITNQKICTDYKSSWMYRSRGYAVVQLKYFKNYTLKGSNKEDTDFKDENVYETFCHIKLYSSFTRLLCGCSCVSALCVIILHARRNNSRNGQEADSTEGQHGYTTYYKNGTVLTYIFFIFLTPSIRLIFRLLWQVYEWSDWLQLGRS